MALSHGHVHIYVYESFLRSYLSLHENDIDHTFSELRTRAGDMAPQQPLKRGVRAPAKPKKAPNAQPEPEEVASSSSSSCDSEAAGPSKSTPAPAFR
ncbi:hypothetical protein HID58_048401 [Brassica napus]|uniref:Uncharacterized protein n=1 Tax=Brassica napus TaxID=3708 RepID=A0ABQ8B270_BRANA|nr:hypothetical protein HID58_048401 [Brassica napus]